MSTIPEEKLYSVGSVARDTGLREETLRVWERRYGNPTPVRLPSGHRRYTHEQLLLLRKVAVGMAGGLRPGKLLRMSSEELDEAVQPADSGNRTEVLAPFLKAIAAFDANGLQQLLDGSLRQKGMLPWLQEIVAPLTTETGNKWVEGQFSVHQEHFFSHIVSTYLQSEAQRLMPEPGKAVVLLATLPGERHGIGLLMASLIIASHGFPVRHLGVDLPVESLLAAQFETRAEAVALSVSPAGGGPATDRILGQIRKDLPESCQLLVGGSGARQNRRGIRGIKYLGDLKELSQWCEQASP